MLSLVVEDNSDVQAFYILGDFNAHINEPFHRELIDFVLNHRGYVHTDKIGAGSDTCSTYIKDVYGWVYNNAL